MMKCWFALMFGLSLSVPALASESAQARLFCTSVRVLPGTTTSGQANTLKISTDSSLVVINNELSPLYDPSVYFRLEGPGFPNPLTGQFALDTPGFTDVNNDGFDDFFEVSQAVNSDSSDGFYTTSSDAGTLTAVWTRPAGAAAGTLRLTFEIG